jgi:hypothetical protein
MFGGLLCHGLWRDATIFVYKLNIPKFCALSIVTWFIFGQPVCLSSCDCEQKLFEIRVPQIRWVFIYWELTLCKCGQLCPPAYVYTTCKLTVSNIVRNHFTVTTYFYLRYQSAHAYLSALEAPLPTTSVLQPLLARLGKSSSANLTCDNFI